MSQASLLKSDQKGFVIMLTPYDKDFVEIFKAEVPYPHRKWDVDKKHWLVAETMLEKTLELMKLFFDEITTNLGSEEPGITNVWETMFKDIPSDYVYFVFRALAQAL